MRIVKLFTGYMLLVASASMAISQEVDPLSKERVAVNNLFPSEKYDIWAYAKGDLNNDGIEDLAVVLTKTASEKHREERLAVFSGTTSGNYSTLAVSNEFCNVGQFYNLEIKRNSVFITGISSITPSSSYTLQFRNNAKRKDLELVGQESLEENEEENTYYRVSVNYLNNKIIYSRKNGNAQKEIEVKMNKYSLAGLQGFNCLTYRGSFKELSYYLDKDFSFRK